MTRMYRMMTSAKATRLFISSYITSIHDKERYFKEENRVVLSKGMRNILRINEADPIWMVYFEGDQIIVIKKDLPGTWNIECFIIKEV